jgi:hypothetical protein
MRAPTKVEVRLIADDLRNPPLENEQHGFDLMTLAWEKTQPIDVIADLKRKERNQGTREAA